jgi:phospholipid methyltransferase
MAALDRGAGVKFPPPLLYVFLARRHPRQHLVPAWRAATYSSTDAGRGAVGGRRANRADMGIRALHRTGTIMRPDRPSQHLAVSGPFRFRRNPLYLALGFICAGVTLFANSLWALILLIPVILIMQLGNPPRERPPGARLRRAIRALHQERPPLALIGPIRRPADADGANLEAFGGFLPGRSFRLMVALRTAAPYKLTSTASESHPAITFESS